MKWVYEHYGISEYVIKIKEKSDFFLKSKYEEIDRIKLNNFYKVLLAMQECGLSERHFNWSTGYGYGDEGRAKTEEIYSKIFKTEDALVRTQIVNGTHALTLMLKSVLKNGDRLIFISGMPYDTLHGTIGLGDDKSASLIEMGVDIEFVELNPDGSLNDEEIMRVIASGDVKKTFIYLQRSSGYSQRSAITIDEMKRVFDKIKEKYQDMLIMVDNCYGEFVETLEPTEVGADIIAGSLIKNPGGSLALSGGYIAGSLALIKRCAKFLTTPSIEKECGLTFGQTRSILQGLFLAPEIVSNAVKSAVLCAKMFEDSGYEVSPTSTECRSDIVQIIKLGSKDKIEAFCKAIQSVAPVDSFVTPSFSDMAGYDNQIIMAAGAFIQGSSIELSADAPVREPYSVYYQGGTMSGHGEIGVMKALQNILDIEANNHNLEG